MVEPAERVGVSIRAAQGLYRGGSDAQLRTALILLDSAAELLLYVAVRDEMQWWPMREQMYSYATEPVETVTLPASVKLADMPKDARWSLSKSAKDKVEHEFKKKLELLEFTGTVPTAYRIALSRLHDYRNAAYHRDVLRAETLRTSVELFFYLVAQLLRLFRPMMWRLPDREEVQRIATLLDVSEESAMGGQPGLQHALAAAILGALDLEEQGVQAVLATNVIDRVDSLEDQLDLVLDVIPEHGLTRADVIRIVQDDNVPMSIDAMRRKQYAITQRKITSWRTDAETVRQASTAIDGFNLYADIESRMGAFETAVEKMAIAADQEVQRQIDERRGK